VASDAAADVCQTFCSQFGVNGVGVNVKITK
jgi:hypothetical protein